MKRSVRNIRGIKPFLFGFGSLGNISGGYISFRRYMRGNNLDDMRKDWEKVGNDIRIVMSKKNW